MSRNGPIESTSWPRELSARAIDDGAVKRMHGYDVEADLARHYSFSDVVFLSLTGELPDDGVSRAFAAVLTFATAMSVAEAPVHASVLARLCGCRPAGVLSVASLAVGEHAHRLLTEIGTALDVWRPGEELPAQWRSRDEAEADSVARLAERLSGAVDVPLLSVKPNRDVALVAVLRACGLTTSFQIVTALSVGRLPAAIAEAALTKPADFRTYPMDTPPFVYEPPRGVRP